MTTKIFAHRGASRYAPENTMAAFQLAHKMKADGIELDVQLTKDGIPVVIHDESVNRTTNGKGLIKNLTLTEVKELDAGICFSKKYKGESIPTLEEVLKWMAPTKMLLNIELKNNLEAYEGMEEIVLQLVERHKMAGRVVYSSFNHYSLKVIKDLDPNAEVGVLYHHEKLFKPWNYITFVGADSAHPNYKMLNDEIIAGFKEAGIKVRPYTINNPSKMAYFFKNEMEAIITDTPDIARSILENGTKPKFTIKSMLFKKFAK